MFIPPITLTYCLTMGKKHIKAHSPFNSSFKKNPSSVTMDA